MPTRKPCQALAALAALALVCTPALSLARQQKEEKKDKKKDEPQQQQQAAKPSKQEREYQKIKQFSVERYGKNPEFKEDVEEAYRQKQREHSEYAFIINTHDQSDARRTQSGDKLKVKDTLYDNPLAQDYVNRVGQSVVPHGSARLYAFKITLNPIPEARSLSTGTVYVSSGLLAQIDNEAQLAYILGHEIAHIERDHWKEDVLVQHGLAEYNEKQKQKQNLIGSLANVGSRVMSGGFINAGNMLGLTASMFAEMSVPTLVKMAVPDAIVSWDKQQEDEADQAGLQYMLARNYDPHEVPKFYEALKRASAKDRRAGLGFMANAARVAERIDFITSGIGPIGGGMQAMLMVGAVNLNMQRQLERAQQQAAPAPEKAPDTGKTLDPSRDAAGRADAARATINTQMSDEIRAKLDAGQLIGSTAEFLAVMAELKRDNGIRAYYYDMFQMARDNLSESLQIRSNDPYAHFYYGKVLKLTARTAAEKAQAMAEFRRAIDLDQRGVLPEARLHRALALMEGKDPAQVRGDVIAALKEYVALYQRENSGALPPNMDVIYDYMQDAGDTLWSASPALNVSTKNIDPIGVATVSAARPQPAAQAAPAAPQPPQSTPAPQPGARTQRGNGRRP